MKDRGHTYLPGHAQLELSQVVKEGEQEELEEEDEDRHMEVQELQWHVEEEQLQVVFGEGREQQIEHHLFCELAAEQAGPDRHPTAQVQKVGGEKSLVKVSADLAMLVVMEAMHHMQPSAAVMS
jgi:hypothetical protein